VNFPVDLPSHLLALAAQLRVRPEDIEEQFMRGSGRGGQRRNKRSTAVHLKHIPTGLEVRCDKKREQLGNRVDAYKILILKIDAQARGKKSERARAIYKIRKQKARRTKRAKEKMLAAKKQRGAVKKLRRGVVE
jgi:protein subunit release factor B